MVKRGRHPHRRLALVGAASVIAALAGCSSGSGADAEVRCAAPNPAPPAEMALMPAGLSFDPIGTVSHVQRTDGNITVRAVTTKSLDEVTVLIQDAVTAAGYRPAGMDNEGSEAEVFFNLGSLAAGQARVRRADCEGQWDIDLVLVDPRTAPSTTSRPTTT